MRRRVGSSFWQSFSDLSMGVMAVVLLILILLMRQQQKQNEDFTVELLDALERAEHVVSGQDEVKSWVQAVFEESDCNLRFDAESGILTRASGVGPATLYPTGETRLDRDARTALQSCRRNFLALAVCMGQDELAQRECTRLVDELIAEGASAGALESEKARAALRGDVEALVLQGNTDRVPFVAPTVRDLDDRGLGPERWKRQAFVTNSYLGAERARQALGHLLYQVHHAGEHLGTDVTEMMMGKVRVESPSFGLYQTAGGPFSADCDAGTAECEAARNLALKLRLKQSSLRRPFDKIRHFFCQRWRSGDEALRAKLPGERAKTADRICPREPE